MHPSGLSGGGGRPRTAASNRPWSLWALGVALALGSTAGGCVGGDIGDRPAGSVGAGPGVGPQAACNEGPQPGPAPIRRMTRFEYNNTVRDLVGDTTHPADIFDLEEEALGFNNNAANLVVSTQLAEKYMLVAEGIAERATEPLSNVVDCDPAAIAEDTCAAEFIATFGARAFRRPLSQAETDMFTALYVKARVDGDFRTGIQFVIEAALQSPPFLYRVELGDPKSGDEVEKVTSWEMASRLSYLLWGTMPDDELFAAAEAGELATPEQIEAQARRLLADPRAHEAVENFHAQWLDYGRIANVGKDATLFPAWSPALAELMRQETAGFIDYAIFEGDGTLETLLTAPYSVMNAELAEFYGVDASKLGDAFEKVDLDPKQRAGLLTTGTLLTINAHSNQTSPVHRGKLVREQFLCDIMPPPPPNVNPKAPEPEAGTTAKERFAQHSSDPACAGCHVLMDPLGFGFEHYDAIARFRNKEGGATIDATGELTQSDVDGPFDGAIELAQKLAGSGDVQSCYLKQWFRFGYGRAETKEDVCSMQQLETKFAETDFDIRELLVALTQTDAFMYRKAGGAP